MKSTVVAIVLGFLMAVAGQPWAGHAHAAVGPAAAGAEIDRQHDEHSTPGPAGGAQAVGHCGPSACWSIPPEPVVQIQRAWPRSARLMARGPDLPGSLALSADPPVPRAR